MSTREELIQLITVDARCLVPAFGGVILSLEWKDALWDRFYTAAPRRRTQSEQQYSDPLDDCLYALQPTIPHLTRSSLHRCLQRHRISRLPDVDGDKPAKKKFKRYPIGYFHLDIAVLHTTEGKLHLYVAIDRTSKFAFVQLVDKANQKTASAFLEALVEAVPYKVNIILTDNGIQYTFPPRYKDGPTATYMNHMFDMRCRENGIEHRLTKIRHPWTNGQVERMNRSIKDATVKRYHYDDHGQLRDHLNDFINAYNYARRLKTLGGLTPYEYICKI